MKIALVTPQWSKTMGGPSQYVASLRAAFDHAGHQTSVMTSDEGPGAIHLPAGSPGRELALFASLRRERPEIVHIHGRAHFIAPALAYRAINRGAAIVFSFHTQPYIKRFLEAAPAGTPDYAGMRRRVAMALFSRCDAITTVSASIVENLNRDYGLGLTAVTIPSAGRAVSASADGVRALRERFQLEDAWPVLSSVGVLSWDWKVAGHLASIRALGVLVERYPRIRLLLAGDGQYRHVLRDEVARLALQDRVHFLGNFKQPADVLATSDLYVHMAPHEGCSLAIIEAMFAGRPIVASNEGGTPGVLRDGETAYLVDREPASIAARLASLIDNPARARAFANRARADAEAHYTWPVVAQQYETLYREVRERRARAW